jgi:hypothetical protein
VCSEALGRWLPSFGAVEPGRTPTRLFDGFGRTRARFSKAFDAYVPNATAAVYGEAGPSRAKIVYDPVHHSVFYGGGCCAYYKVVLSSGIPPPPVAVANENLAAVRTKSEIGLGDTPRDVMRVYGAAPFQHVTMRGPTVFLFYENTAPPKPYACVQRETFGFTGGRLSYLEIYDGC